MTDDFDYDAYEREIRSGVCPSCGGRLDQPHLPKVYWRSPPPGGWTGWRERTCYGCGDEFGYYINEEA